MSVMMPSSFQPTQSISINQPDTYLILPNHLYRIYVQQERATFQPELRNAVEVKASGPPHAKKQWLG